MDKALLDYIRRLSEVDKKNLSQKALKAAEEVGELAKAVLPYENAFATTHRFTAREAVLEEAVDTILTAISCAYDLKFTDEEIEEMMWRKSKYWDKLQRREQNLKYPIPFEIHITVEPTNEVHTKSIDMFKAICHGLNVKPILLDLHTSQGRIVQDVMTSSKVFGTNTNAYHEMQYISDNLQRSGYKVVREKIETVPWHPAAPQDRDDVMPPNCYFESHLPVTLKSERDREKLAELCKEHDLHLSRNVFKKHEDGSSTIMATYRLYEGYYDYFDLQAHLKAQYLIAAEFEVGDIITEFSIYDTKLSHDFSWMGKQDEIR